jgi:glutaredoxin
VNAVLYTRHGCSPCFAMRRAAARAARRSGVDLVVVDVDSDPALSERYGHEVPVLVLPDGAVLRGRVEPGAIAAAFAAATAAAGPGVAARARRVVTSVARRLGFGREEKA